MVSIVSRSQWGARAPRSRSTVGWGSRVEVTLHYSSGPTSQTPRQIQDFHMDSNGWDDVGYNLLVDSDGTAYEGRGWTVVGAHAAPRNAAGIGICYIGRDGMTPAAKRTVIALYDEACRRAGRTLTRKGHRDINPTSCPGSKNNAWWKSTTYRSAAGGGVISEGEAMLGLKKGDTGEAVGLLQYKVRLCGDKYADLLGDFGDYKDGVDEDYGDATEKAVAAVRKDYGSSSPQGHTVSVYTVGQIEAMVARNQGGK